MRFHRTRTAPIIAITIATALAVFIPLSVGSTSPRLTLPRSTQEVASWRPTPSIFPHVIPSSAPPPTTTTVPPPTTTTTTSPPAPVVLSPPASPPTSPPSTSPTPVSSSGDAYAEWSRVATCEEGGWIGYAGPAYPDSLGINAANWAHYGGGTDMSPANQIRVAQDIEAAAGTPGYVPDQGYCASW